MQTSSGVDEISRSNNLLGGIREMESEKIPYESLGNEHDYQAYVYQKMIPEGIRAKITFGDFVELVDSIPSSLKVKKES